MNVKIQGGNEAYTNTGSCINVAYYLEHEDYHRMEQGFEVEPFFSQHKDNIEKRAFVLEMDNNKAKLCKDDAKFYVVTISPSKEEISKMGDTEQERSRRFKQFIREEVIPQYANGFGKGLTADDIMYFAKIHHTRKDSTDREMHCHLVISRKTMNNKIKISPKTNHKVAKTSGTVKSGFDRTAFYQSVETSFDKMFHYERTINERFEYLNIINNGSLEDLEKFIVKDRFQKIINSHKNLVQNNKQTTHNIQVKEQSTPLLEETLSSPDIFLYKPEDDDLLCLSKKKKKSKKRDSGLSL